MLTNHDDVLALRRFESTYRTTLSPRKNNCHTSVRTTSQYVRKCTTPAVTVLSQSPGLQCLPSVVPEVRVHILRVLRPTPVWCIKRQLMAMGVVSICTQKLPEDGHAS